MVSSIFGFFQQCHIHKARIRSIENTAIFCKLCSEIRKMENYVYVIRKYKYQEFEINAKSEMLSRFVNRVLEHSYSHLKQYILAIE